MTEAPPPVEGASFEYRLQRTPVGVVVLDDAGCIRSLNPTARRLLGAEAGDADWRGRPILDLHPPGARAKVQWLMDCARSSDAGDSSLVVTTPIGSLVAKVTRLAGGDGLCMMFHALGGQTMGLEAPDTVTLVKLPLVRGKGGVTTLVDVAEVASLSAQGHYAEARTLEGRAFCPRSLADLERRLDARVFVRVHRGHLVNLRHVLAAERVNGRLCLRLADAAGTVIPVSRDKVALIRRLLAV